MSSAASAKIGWSTTTETTVERETFAKNENITMDGITLAGSGRLRNVAPWTQFFDLQGYPAPSRQINNVTPAAGERISARSARPLV